jgi:hypothetical protein
LDCRHVCKTCVFHDAVQTGKQLAPADLFLFPRLKSIMKSARFAVLRSIPKEAFAESFQKLYERCQQCVVNDGDYFEGQ